MTILGIIPARGGSKGIPRKNIAPVAGKPLLAWTVEAALTSRILDRVLVSTEDAEIADIARASGAEVPFLRPQELARDETPGIDPVLHALDFLDREGYRPEWVMLLQPTSPLRLAEDIRGAREVAIRTGGDLVISVSEAVPPPAWMRKIDADGILQKYFEQEETPDVRQQLPTAFALNGAIYFSRVSTVRTRRSFSGGRAHPYVMPRERSLDVDTPWDLELAQMILLRRRGS
jgi:CMP-N,N'-diacetyllegionaminic acid synthase